MELLTNNNITHKQRKAIELMALGNMTQKEIAAEINVSENTIGNWKKHEWFTDEIYNLNKQAFKNLAPQAINTLKKLMNSKQEGVALGACNAILDRAGFTSNNLLQIESITPVIITGGELIEE